MPAASAWAYEVKPLLWSRNKQWSITIARSFTSSAGLEIGRMLIPVIQVK